MISISVFVLLLSLSTLSEAYTCSAGGTVPAGTVTIDISNSIQKCTLGGQLQFSVADTVLPSHPSVSQTKSFVLEHSTSTNQSYLIFTSYAFNGTQKEAVALSAPVNILVQFNTFTSRSIVVEGVYPPRSNLTFHNNTMLITNGRWSYADYMKYDPSGVTFWDICYARFLNETLVAITNNYCDQTRGPNEFGHISMIEWIATEFRPCVKHLVARNTWRTRIVGGLVNTNVYMFLAIKQGFTMLPKSEVIILDNIIDVNQSQAETYAGPNTAFRCDNCVVNNAVLAIRGMYVANFYNSAKHSSTFISFWTPMLLIDGAIFEFSGTRNGYALGYNYASVIGMMSYDTNANPGAYISLGTDCMFVVKDNQFTNVETSLAYGQSASTSIFNAPQLVVAGTNAEVRLEDNIIRVTKTIPSLVKGIALNVTTVTAPVGTELRVIFRRNTFTFTGNFPGSAAPVLLTYDMSTSATAKALATRVSFDQTTWRDENSATEVPIFSGTAKSPQHFTLSVCKTTSYGSYFETTSDYYRGVDQTSSTLSVASSCYPAVNYDVPPAVDSSVFLFCGTRSLSFSPSWTDKGLLHGLSTTRSLYVTDTRTQHISQSSSGPVDSETKSDLITQSYSGHGATSSQTKNVRGESPTHSGGQSSRTHTGVLTLSKSYLGGSSQSQTHNIDGSISRTHDLKGGESKTQTGGNNDGLSNTHSKNSDLSETLTMGTTESRTKHNDLSETLTVDQAGTLTNGHSSSKSLPLDSSSLTMGDLTASRTKRYDLSETLTVGRSQTLTSGRSSSKSLPLDSSSLTARELTASKTKHNDLSATLTVESSQTIMNILSSSKSLPLGSSSLTVGNNNHGMSKTITIGFSSSRSVPVGDPSSSHTTVGNGTSNSMTHGFEGPSSSFTLGKMTLTLSRGNAAGGSSQTVSLGHGPMSETRTVVSLAGSGTFTRVPPHTKTGTDLRLSVTHTRARFITHTFENLTTKTSSLAGTSGSASIVYDRTLTNSLSASGSGKTEQAGRMSQTLTVDGSIDSRSFTHSSSQNHALRTVSIAPPNLTTVPERTYPEPIINGAPPENIIKDLINSGEKDGNVEILTLFASSLAGDKEALIQAVRGASCRRFERLASSRALLTPSLHQVVLGGDGNVMRVLSYREALLSSLVALGLILLFLFAVTLPSGLIVAARKMKERKQAFSGFGAQRGVSELASLVKEALYEVRFPATATQSIIFLVNGAAISAGMSLFRGGDEDVGSVAYNDEYQYDPATQTINPSAIITLVFIVVILPLGSLVTARFVFAKRLFSNESEEVIGSSPRHRWLAVAASGTGPTNSHGRKDKYVNEGTDDLDVNDDGVGSAATKRKQTDDDAPQGPNPSSVGLFGGSVELICHGVRPLREARVLGPIGGSDIRFNHPAAAAFPFLAPVLLVLTTIIINAAGRCDLLPATSGGVYLFYALLVCIARPLLGISHNAVECLSSTIVGALLLCLFFSSFSPDSSFFSSFGEPSAESRLLGGGGEATVMETVCFLLIGALSNARFPFVLARVLDVSLPTVGEVKINRRGAHHRRQQRQHESRVGAGGTGESFQIRAITAETAQEATVDRLVEEEDNIVIALSQEDHEDSDDFDETHTSRSSSVELDLGVPPSLTPRILSDTDDDDLML